jgi:hypothetical protein
LKYLTIHRNPHTAIRQDRDSPIRSHNDSNYKVSALGAVIIPGMEVKRWNTQGSIQASSRNTNVPPHLRSTATIEATLVNASILPQFNSREVDMSYPKGDSSGASKDKRSLGGHDQLTKESAAAVPVQTRDTESKTSKPSSKRAIDVLYEEQITAGMKNPTTGIIDRGSSANIYMYQYPKHPLVILELRTMCGFVLRADIRSIVRVVAILDKIILTLQGQHEDVQTSQFKFPDMARAQRFQQQVEHNKAKFQPTCPRYPLTTDTSQKGMEIDISQLLPLGCKEEHRVKDEPNGKVRHMKKTDEILGKEENLPRKKPDENPLLAQTGQPSSLGDLVGLEFDSTLEQKEVAENQVESLDTDSPTDDAKRESNSKTDVSLNKLALTADILKRTPPSVRPSTQTMALLEGLGTGNYSDIASTFDEMVYWLKQTRMYEGGPIKDFAAVHAILIYLSVHTSFKVLDRDDQQQVAVVVFNNLMQIKNKHHIKYTCSDIIRLMSYAQAPLSSVELAERMEHMPRRSSSQGKASKASDYVTILILICDDNIDREGLRVTDADLTDADVRNPKSVAPAVTRTTESQSQTMQGGLKSSRWA